MEFLDLTNSFKGNGGYTGAYLNHYIFITSKTCPFCGCVVGGAATSTISGMAWEMKRTFIFQQQERISVLLFNRIISYSIYYSITYLLLLGCWSLIFLVSAQHQSEPNRCPTIQFLSVKFINRYRQRWKKIWFTFGEKMRFPIFATVTVTQS